MTRLRPSTPIRLSVLALAAALAVSACGGGGAKEAKDAKPSKTVIQNKGSDTMVNVAQVWAEEYRKAAPDVEVEVSGGGSGVGIAALLKGAVDVANASRDIKPSEAEQASKNTGQVARRLQRRRRRPRRLRPQGQPDRPRSPSSSSPSSTPRGAR